MATQGLTSACPACDCTDSPLSITGDLTGIITFALVAWASIVYCFRSFRDFEHELRDMQHRVQIAFEEAQRLRRTFIERQRVSAPLSPQPAGVYPVGVVSDDLVARRRRLQQNPFLIDEAWVRAEKEMIRASKFVNKRLLKPATVVGSLVRRAIYVLERERAAETIERLGRAMENLKGIVADVSGQPSTGKELCAMKMEADLAELRKQNEELRELVNSMLHSVSRHDFRLEESKL